MKLFSKLLLSLTLIAINAIPCNGMQKYYNYILEQETKCTSEILQACPRGKDVPYNVSLKDLDAELERQIGRRIMLTYFVAPAAAVIGLGIAAIQFARK